MNIKTTDQEETMEMSDKPGAHRKMLWVVGATALAGALVLSGTSVAAAQTPAMQGSPVGSSASAGSLTHHRHHHHHSRHHHHHSRHHHHSHHHSNRAPSHHVRSEKEFAKQYMRTHFGWGNAQYRATVAVFNRESGWNYHAMNRSSGAYGIPQALPGWKMASAGHDWRNNSHTQIKWGLYYMKHRYGSATRALQHEYRYGWY